MEVKVHLELLNQAGDHHHVVKTENWKTQKFTILLLLQKRNCELERKADGVSYMVNETERLHQVQNTSHCTLNKRLHNYNYRHQHRIYRIARYIGGNNIWRIARKRKKIAIGGYKFGGYGTITTPSLGVGVILAV